MPAGAAPSGEYWKDLTRLLRQDFGSGAEDSGIAACLELKARIEEDLKADFLLIDSRTGITEMAGLATTLLADKVVCLMIYNRESLIGTRAVLRSFGRAPRLKSQSPIELFPVLSRVPREDDDTLREVLSVLNEPGPSADETLSLKRLYVLRADPDLATEEKLHVGGASPNRSPLYRDYLALFETMVTADPSLVAIAARRHEAIAEMKHWLTDDDDSRHYRRLTPDPFKEEQVEEGIELGNGDKRRYADLVVYSGKDRADVLMAVEYVEDIVSSRAWQWWEANTDLRCVILIGNEEGKYLQRRVFTRGKRHQKLKERDETAGWIVKWPASFVALEDPGDRTVDSMLKAVQRGDESFIGLLVTEWQHSSFVTLHGGGPYRPRLARRILDGLAQVTDRETEMHILWRTAPDRFGRDFERFGPEGDSLDDIMTSDLYAPLWWRLSVEAKFDHWRHRGPKSGGTAASAGMDMLARDLLGLTLNQDRDFRREVRQLTGEDEGVNDEEIRVYRFADLFRDRELKFELSDDAPPELTRRAALEYLLDDDADQNDDSVWDHASHVSREALEDNRLLSRLLRGANQHPQIAITNLLGAYEAEACAVTVYPKLTEWASHILGVETRALANVAFMHHAVYAVCHIGRDLDQRMWDNFGLPPSRDINFHPNILMETFASYFSFRLLERLADASLTLAFDRLCDVQPVELQRWKKLKSVPIEEVRKLLMRARAGTNVLSLLDGSS
jgi:hypothetical protein